MSTKSDSDNKDITKSTCGTCNTFLLEEYKTLRSEILLHIDGTYKHLNMIIGVNSVVVAGLLIATRDWFGKEDWLDKFVARIEYPLFLLVLSLILYFLNINYIKGELSRHWTIRRISSYIIIKIEKNCGIQWESVIAKWKEKYDTRAGRISLLHFLLEPPMLFIMFYLIIIILCQVVAAIWFYKKSYILPSCVWFIINFIVDYRLLYSLPLCLLKKKMELREEKSFLIPQNQLEEVIHTIVKNQPPTTI